MTSGIASSLLESWIPISVTWWYIDPHQDCISDCSIPFSVDDIAKLMVHVDMADMDLPPLIQESNGSKLGHWNERRTDRQYTSFLFRVAVMYIASDIRYTTVLRFEFWLHIRFCFFLLRLVFVCLPPGWVPDWLACAWLYRTELAWNGNKEGLCAWFFRRVVDACKPIIPAVFCHGLV